MRVFQGVTGQAGQPWTLAEGLRKIGIEADSWAVSEHKFAYAAHRSMTFDRATRIDDAYEMLRPLIDSYDVFHFHARSFLTNWPDLSAPSLQDLMLLRLHGRKVYFHFRGQEIRLADEFKKLNPFHYVDDESGYLFSKMPDKSKRLLRGAVASICNQVFVVDEELQSYAPNATVVPRALDATNWKYVGVGDGSTPIVVHAPSRRGVKGTPDILAALDQLRSEGVKFELRLVENLPNDQAREIYRSADILVDQIRIGWYGVLAVEGFALGKPVVAYIRDDLWERQKDVVPVWNANPLNIKSRLKQLIEDAAIRKALSQRARSYFEQVHSSVAVAEKLAQIYRMDTQPSSLAGYAALLEHQSMLSAPSSGRWTLPALVREYVRIHRADGATAAWRTFGHWARQKVGRSN